MRNRYILLIIVSVFISCGENVQKEKLITKYRTYNNSDKKIKEIYIKGNNRIWEKNYASNGWQVYDSIVFNNDKSTIYKAEYNEGTRDVFKYYDSVEVDLTPSRHKQKLYKLLIDKYSLSHKYIDDIAFILETMKTEESEIKTKDNIKTNYIPSILVNYGIPYNETLDSCSYNIESGLLKSDTFFFENHKINRQFTYNEQVLSKVITERIKLKNNERVIIQEKISINNN